MPLTKSYIVYMHTNKANGKVYVGITRQKPERRWQNGAGYARTYFGNAISKYGWDGFTHEIIASGLTEKEACEMEISLIARLHSDDKKRGYNICEGGQTGDNLKPHYGTDNNRAASVKRIDTATGESKTYKTVKEAATEMNINYRGISKACHGISNTYKGFVWEYADREYKKPRRNPRGKYAHIHQQKRTVVIDVDGKEYTFDSIKAAADYFGVRANTATRYASGVRHDPSGRGWSICL